jgi:hypothetical protein
MAVAATTTIPRPGPRADRAPGPRPELKVVDRRRRWPAVVVGLVSMLLLAAMLGAAVFHTQLAQRQLRIDDLGERVQEERARFDELRLERAGLRSPQRLAIEASRLGMSLAPQSEYLAVDGWAFARQLAAAGPVREGIGRIIVQDGPLDQFRDVKSVAVGQP